MVPEKPFNSFVVQAVAAMVRSLRERAGLGLVTTVSGMLTKPGLGVWSSSPGDGPPLVADLRHRAAEVTELVDVLLSYDGPATMAAVTVTYQGLDPAGVIAVLDNPAGDRVIARSADPALIERATTEELIGLQLEVRGNQICL